MKRKPYRYNSLALAITIMLTLAQWTVSWADETTDAALLGKLRRNCVPNGYDRSPEIYLVYHPDVLTSSDPEAAFACSHDSSII